MEMFLTIDRWKVGFVPAEVIKRVELTVDYRGGWVAKMMNSLQPLGPGKFGYKISRTSLASLKVMAGTRGLGETFTVRINLDIDQGSKFQLLQIFEHIFPVLEKLKAANVHIKCGVNGGDWDKFDKAVFTPEGFVDAFFRCPPFAPFLFPPLRIYRRTVC